MSAKVHVDSYYDGLIVKTKILDESGNETALRAYVTCPECGALQEFKGDPSLPTNEILGAKDSRCPECKSNMKRNARKLIEAKVIEDYEAIKGKVLEVTSGVHGFLAGKMVEVGKGIPLIVRVESTGTADLLMWRDNVERRDCIDPCWMVRLLTTGGGVPEDFDASWMFGTSRHLDGKVEAFQGKILGPGYHARCRMDIRNHRRFKTVATVLQDWVVDQNGEFIEVVDEDRCLETVHGPTHENEWVCETCGETADVIVA